MSGFFEDFKQDKVFTENNSTQYIHEELEQLNKQIENLESLRGFLLSKHRNLENQLTTHPTQVINKVDYLCENIRFAQSDLLSITIPFKLPIYKKIVGKKYSYYQELNHNYAIPLTDSLSHMENKLHFNEVFVLITHYTSNNIILDTDNRFNSFIFNALRYSNIINDDNHSLLSYMENGLIESELKASVRVIICERKNMAHALKYNETVLDNLPTIR